MFIKSQNWSIESIIAISLFLVVFIVSLSYISMLPSDDSTQIAYNSEVVLNGLEFDLGLIDNYDVDEAKLEELSVTDVSSDYLAETVGVDGDICISFENMDGEIIYLSNGKKGLGVDDLGVCGGSFSTYFSTKSSVSGVGSESGTNNNGEIIVPKEEYVPKPILYSSSGGGWDPLVFYFQFDRQMENSVLPSETDFKFYKEATGPHYVLSPDLSFEWVGNDMLKITYDHHSALDKLYWERPSVTDFPTEFYTGVRLTVWDRELLWSLS